MSKVDVNCVLDGTLPNPDMKLPKMEYRPAEQMFTLKTLHQDPI